MTTPTPAPAPMTARLREIIDVWVDAADGENERAHHLLDALTSRVSRLLEAVDGAEKALEKIEGMSVPDQPAAFALSRETYLMRWVAKLRGEARSALATLRAAREGAR